MNIDQEFKSLIPPLSTEEYAQLESNLKAEGCRDPLVTWEGFIIDGHNRHEICTRNGIGFQTVTKEFTERGEVIEWIIRNQFGRRNLDAYQRTKLALRLEEVIAVKASERMKSGRSPDPLQNSVKGIHTSEELGKLAGVSRDTVDKVKQIEKKATPEVKASLAKGEISINKAHMTTKALKEDEEIEPLVVDGSKKSEIKFIESNGMGIFYVAKSHMEKIAKNDTERANALTAMVKYCQERISQNK
jgi:hypothetical protein